MNAHGGTTMLRLIVARYENTVTVFCFLVYRFFGISLCNNGPPSTPLVYNYHFSIYRRLHNVCFLLMVHG